MEPNKRYDLVGGIAAVVIYPASAPLPMEPTTQIAPSTRGYAISLESGAASYVETMTPESTTAGALNYTVRHTLSFQSTLERPPFYDHSLEMLINEGVVADVKLASGATIRLGWSERYGVEYPLRLVSSTFDSGTAKLDYPLKSWVLESVDQNILL